MQRPVVILLIIGVLGGFGVYKAKSDATNLNQIAEETYQKTLNGYNINVSKHNQRYSETMNKHHQALSTLETVLEQYMPKMRFFLMKFQKVYG